MSQKSPHSDRSTVMQLSLAVMAIAALASSFTAHAQGLSDAEISRLKNYLFDELTKQNFVKLNRVTKQGELSSCETEFQYVYRDVRARQGSPVVLTGSFSSTWTPGKLPSFMYKINAAEMNIKDTKWTVSNQHWLPGGHSGSIEFAGTSVKWLRQRMKACTSKTCSFSG